MSRHLQPRLFGRSLALKRAFLEGLHGRIEAHHVGFHAPQQAEGELPVCSQQRVAGDHLIRRKKAEAFYRSLE